MWLLSAGNCTTVVSQRGAAGGARSGLGCPKMCNCHAFWFPRGVLLEVHMALSAPKCATVTHFALPEGCCWRCSIWPWMLQSVQLSHSLLSQRGAVRGARSGFECSKVCNCHTVCSPRGVLLLEVVDLALNARKCANCHTACSLRGVLLEVVDLALSVPKCATVTHCALPKGCC